MPVGWPSHRGLQSTALLSALLCAAAAPVWAAVGIAAPPEGFTALFNGEDLTNWRGFVCDPLRRAKMSDEEFTEAQARADEAMRAHWSVEDGVLVFDGKGASLVTAEDYGDFELYVDWMIEPGGDSGVYLRGSPQVQIWDNPIGSGGLYNNQKNPSRPTVVADKPPKQWNTFRIVMIGERVSVWLNDKCVVEEVVLENYWDRGKPIYETGSIELQSHGSKLWFRNIFVREIADADAERGLLRDAGGEVETDGGP